MERIDQANDSNSGQQFNQQGEGNQGIAKHYLKAQLFEFDPNVLDADGWKKLGLRASVIRTILNYRNKGGLFKQATDIRKIWGLNEKEANAIIPFIRIQGTQKGLHDNSQAYKKGPFTSLNPEVLDINTATVQQFRQLPGIGFQLPYRIINFRQKLGGFVTIEQIKDSYGMTDSVYQSILPYLKVDSSTIKKININTVTEHEYMTHPYVSRDMLKAIIIYRNIHGLYHQLDEIKKIIFISAEVFQKIKPYLSID